MLLIFLFVSFLRAEIEKLYDFSSDSSDGMPKIPSSSTDNIFNDRISNNTNSFEDTSNKSSKNMITMDTFNNFSFLILNNQIKITGYSGSGGHIIIPEMIENYPVILIDMYAFKNQTEITKIVLPETITSILDGAFANCINLVEINLPRKLEMISSNFMYNCFSITNITIPKSLKKVMGHPFADSSISKVIFEEGTTNIIRSILYGARLLKEVILPSSLSNIDEFAFYNCSSLSQINIPENVTNIGDYAFAFSNLTSIIIPNKVKTISYNLFADCYQLTKIYLPQNLISIKKEAFYNCFKLENIELPNKITSIDCYAFGNCKSLTELILPNEIEYLGYNFISNCINIHNITIPKSLKGCFAYGSECPFTNSSVTKVIFEEGTTKIVDSLLSGSNIQITDVLLPSSLSIIGDHVFERCSKLTEINLPENVTSIGNYAFSLSGLTSINIPNQIVCINNSLFHSCEELTKIILPPNISKINNAAFCYCTKLEKIELPNQITIIENSAFYSCQTLAEIILPNKIEYIGYQFIGKCANIINISIPKTLKGIYKHSRNYGPFTDSSISKIIFEEGTINIIGYIMYEAKKLNDVILPSSILNIEEYAFAYCSSLKKIKIPENVTYIGKFAFHSTNLESINIPNNIKIINNSLFGDCYQLKSINLPKNLNIIQSGAFYYCVSLKSIDLPNTISFIGDWAFGYCTELTEIILPDKLITISSYLFAGCIKLASIMLPQKITTINNYAFYKCNSLKEINCPNKLTKIDSFAFQFCTSLSKCLIHPDVVSIESNSFSNCSLLTLYVVAGSYAVEYARINNIPFSYFLSAITLNAKIINNSDISGMKLILKDRITNIENTICLTSNTNEYSFYGLLTDHIYDLMLINKYDMYITQKKSLMLLTNYTTIEIIANNTYYINVSVIDKFSNDVTSRTAIRWYDNDKNYLYQTSFISQMINKTKLYFEIELDDKLALEYYNIQSQSLTVVENSELIINLQSINKVNISGTIVNKEGAPVFNAIILISQILNGKYKTNIMASSDIDGYFSTQIYNTSCKSTISKSEYMSKKLEINESIENINAGSITLTEIKGEIITIDINYVKSVINDSEESINKLCYNPTDLKIFIFNTITKEEIHNFVFQNEKLILSNPLDREVPIMLNFSINSDEFNSVVTYIEPNVSDITITFNQRGRLMVMYVTNQNANSIVMIYNKNGKLVNKFDFTLNNVTSTFLEDGEYMIIAMGKSSFFSNFQSLDNLKSSRLTENIDYVSKIANVNSGKISVVKFDNVPQFDESKFYYTDNEKTIFIANKPSDIEGSCFSFKGHLKFKNEYKNNISNIKVLIEIPEKCEYLSGSLIIDKNLAPFTLSENKIIVPIDINADIFRLCLIPIVKGLYIVNAFIEFNLNNDLIFQPIHSTSFEAKEMDIFVPEITGKKNIVSFGVAPITSMIYLFCDDILVGETIPNNIGKWMISFDLINPSSFSEHSIYTKVTLADGINITSKTKNLLYSRNYIDVYQILLYVNEQKVVIDYQRLNQNIYYSVLTGFNQMTFVVNFTDNNPEIIKDVNLIISQLDNNIIRIPAIYDEDKNLWISNHCFTSSSSPTGVEVTYECDEKLTIPDEILYEPINLTEENIKEFENDLELFDFKAKLIQNSFSSEIGIGKIIHEIDYSDDMNNTLEGFSEISVLPISDEEIQKIKQNPDFMQTFDEKGNEYYVQQPDGFKIEYVLVNPTNKTITTFMVSIPILEDLNIDFGDSILLSDFKATFNNVKDWIMKSFNKIKGMIEKYKDYICKKHLGEVCSPENVQKMKNVKKFGEVIKLGYDLYKAYDTAEKYTWKLAERDAACIPEKIINKLQVKVYTYYGLSMTKLVSKLFNGNPLVTGGAFISNYIAKKQLKSFDRLYDKYKCRPQISEYPNSNLMCVAVYTPIIDPSGYVYEAVESNRIKDVTTTIFEKTTKYDIYGDEYEIAEVWNAQLYGQKNPLKTDELGWYAWDVPKGLWQVKYEKVNYETKYSNWLPVPPPQIDVNVPLVSYIQPEVKRVSSYVSRIEIEFTKYMNLDKLDLDNIIITVQNNKIKGNLIYVDKEVDPNNNTLSYASLLHFKPVINLQKDSQIKIFICKNVSSYSGVTMNEDYSEIFKIQVEPTIIIDSDISNITFGKPKNMKYSVDITQIESIKEKKLLLHSDSPNIVELETESIEINNNGKIAIPTKILLPGRAHVEMMIEGTGIKATKTINIDLPKQQLNPVVASIVTESCVTVNTAVELYSNMENSIIFYSTELSLDLDCFNVYRGSIIIIEDTLLSAYAHHDNYRDSEITSYYIKVCKYIIITFNANEGITDISSKNVGMNEKIGYLPIPKREFYSFDGWYMEPSFKNMISNETTVNFSKNTVLYAKWKPNTYVITFETNGGSHVDNITQPHGTEIKEPKSSTKEGYKLVGWYEEVELSNKYVFNLMPTKNITLYAKWTESIKLKSSNKKIILIGVIVGCVVLAIVLNVVIVFAMRMRKKRINNFSSGEKTDQNLPVYL